MTCSHEEFFDVISKGQYKVYLKNNCYSDYPSVNYLPMGETVIYNLFIKASKEQSKKKYH